MYDIYDNDFDKAFDEAVDAIEKKEHRLIWADALKRHYAWWKGGSREMTMDEAKSDFDCIIDLQPTVEVMTKGKYAALMGLHTTTPAFDPDAPLDADFVRAFRVVLEGLAEPTKHGRWINEPNCWYRCSICGEHYPSISGDMKYNYCPNCGARMDEVEE